MEQVCGPCLGLDCWLVPGRPAVCSTSAHHVANESKCCTLPQVGKHSDALRMALKPAIHLPADVAPETCFVGFSSAGGQAQRRTAHGAQAGQPGAGRAGVCQLRRALLQEAGGFSGKLASGAVGFGWGLVGPAALGRLQGAGV